MANKTLSDFPVLTNLDAASVTHVQKELVDYQVPLSTLTQYVTENAEYADLGAKIDGATEKTTPVDADLFGIRDSVGGLFKKLSWANIKASIEAAIGLWLYAVNDVFVQWPIAASNTTSTAFPTAQRPATRFGGTWTQIWNTDAVFFRTEGDFHASDGQNTNRTDGKQTHQAQGHLHTYTNIVSSTTLASGTSFGGATANTSAASNDGTHGTVLAGYENRPQNRLFLLWKRTA